MVLERIGGRKNIDVSVNHASEIYFPHWIYKCLELDEELEFQGLINKEDEESTRKMIIVSLWCIQTDPSDRPSMSKVMDMWICWKEVLISCKCLPSLSCLPHQELQ